MFRSEGSADAEDGSQGRSAKQNLRGLRAAVRMAQEMGARLGRGEVLFGTVPGKGRAARVIRVFGRDGPGGLTLADAAADPSGVNVRQPCLGGILESVRLERRIDRSQRRPLRRDKRLRASGAGRGDDNRLNPFVRETIKGAHTVLHGFARKTQHSPFG